MKRLSLIVGLLALPAMADVTVNVSVSLSNDQVWALKQDYADYSADTNNPAMTQVQWFQMNCTNQLLRAVDRRLQIRKQDFLRTITERWPSLTPAQQSNVVQALPAQ